MFSLANAGSHLYFSTASLFEFSHKDLRGSYYLHSTVKVNLFLRYNIDKKTVSNELYLLFRSCSLLYCSPLLVRHRISLNYRSSY